MSTHFNSTLGQPYGLGSGNRLTNYTPVTVNNQLYPQQINNNSCQSDSSNEPIRVVVQQFSNSQFAFSQPISTTDSGNSTGTDCSLLNNYVNSCPQNEIENLKKQNKELEMELEKARSAYIESNYQMMSANVDLKKYYEKLQQMQKEKLEIENAYKELKLKYEEQYELFPQNTEERSLFCDDCNFEIKSQVALFIHKLNHYFEQSIPKHLQLSTRSFSTMPDDSTHFKYKCHCCEIDSNREFQRHEIYMHIYQYHTFNMPFKCKFCFLYFTSKSYLNDHLIEKHSLSSTNRFSKNNRKRKIDGNNSIALSYVDSTNNIEYTTLNSTLSLSASVQPMVSNTNKQSYEYKHNLESKLNENNSVDNLTFLENKKCKQVIRKIISNLDEDNSLNCKYPGCKFIATAKNHLKFHMSAHLMAKYKCPYCTFVGNRIGEIKRHILKSPKHANQHVYLCPACDFASDVEKTFRNHYSHNHNSSVDVNLVIESLFLNESNKAGQNMIYAI